MSGPLQGVKVVEIGGIGPAPFAAMLLADMGATLVRVERPGAQGLFAGSQASTVNRGRPAIEVDLRSDAGRALILRLAEAADALIEGFRPGVMERLGLGPADVGERNPGLVYGRMTGHGQDGPLAEAAGHDINYLALSGALGAVARRGERPLFPLNLLGDYGGGGMLLALGLVSALFEARSSGRGQVVDAAMVEGVALLTTAIHGLVHAGVWTEPAGTNVIDSGAHFYEVYVAADGGHVAVGAIEPQFYAALLELLEIPAEDAPQWDRERWPELKKLFARRIATKARDEWVALADGRDACIAPVLSLREAPEHPHNRARGTFVQHDGATQPAPAPRFSRSGSSLEPSPDSATRLREFGLSDRELRDFVAAGAVELQLEAHD